MNNKLNQWKKSTRELRKAFRRDNHGSAIVIVIIAMAMIGILATSILWSAYMNYMIKYADIRNKNSFYSAETVMEQIMAGMQHEASAAITLSYQDVMKNWDFDENETNRFNRFATSYLDILVDALKDTGKGTGFYDLAVLQSYVDADLFAGVDLVQWNSSSCKMELVNNTRLVLYDVKVSFTDGNDYVSIINTDIAIDVPRLVFYQSGSIDSLYEYALIGNTGIRTNDGSGASVIDGSIYGGYDDVLKSGGIIVNKASSLTIKDGKLVISKGDISVLGPSAGFIVRDVPDYGSQVYAAGLNLYSASLSLDSKTYVANDLILSGTGSKATLTKEYYGYGMSTATGIQADEDVDASLSSAILINGRSATIDMSGISRLLLAGRAYIGQSLTENSVLSGASKPVLMGESIAVKGNQIAYLVPAECIGTLQDKTLVGQNPLNGAMASAVEDYKLQYGVDFTEVDFNKPIYKLGNKTLSDFGVTDMQHIRKVFAQYNSADSENKTLVYYYLVMDKDRAAEYFVQYYNFNTNKEAIDRYFQKYAAGGIILGDYAAENTQYTILGNSIVSDALSDSGVALLTGFQQTPADGEEAGDGEGEGTGDPADAGYQEVSDNANVIANAKQEAEVLALAQEFANDYAALTTNLTKDISSVGPNQDVFNSIIRESMLRTYLQDNGGTVTFTAEDGTKAVLTNADTYTLSDSKIRLVVAIDKDSNKDDGISGGNIVINSDFTGLIIAQGEVTFNASVSVKRDKMGVYKVLNTKLAEDNEQIPMDFFVNGSGTLADEVTPDAKVDETGVLDVDLSEVVRYMNWIKK